MAKKCAAFVFILVLALSLFSPAATAATPKPIRVQYKYFDEYKSIETAEIEFSQNEEPFVKNGRTLVPLRIISERLGYSVNYDPGSRKINISNDQGIRIVLTIGSRQATVNDRSVELDALPEIRNGVTFVPIRFIAESFDSVVEWIGGENLVTIGRYFLSHPLFLFDERDSTLYLRDLSANKNHTLLTKLDFIRDWVSMSVVATEGGHHLIRILNIHGGGSLSHVYTDMYDVYVADGKAVAEGYFGTGHIYPINSVNPVISADGSKVVIANNKNAVIYDDATLEPIAYYNLIEMFGIDPALVDEGSEEIDETGNEENTFYEVVGYGDNYLIARSGLSKRIVLAHLDTGETVWLYRLFYHDAPSMIEYVDADWSMSEQGGDRIAFVGEKDGQLYFKELISSNVGEFVYDLNSK